MSVHFDPSRPRQPYRVAWRESGRQRIRRFATEEEAARFDASRRTAGPAVDATGGELAALNARLAELEHKLADNPSSDAPQRRGDGVYAYDTAAGRRWRCVFRQSDGTLTSRRGFTTRTAAADAKKAMEVAIGRGEIKVCREKFAVHWPRFLAGKRPYVTRGTLADYETHGRLRLVPAFGELALGGLDAAAVRVWLGEMAERVEADEIAPKTVNNALTLLSVCLNEAARDGLIAGNPCAHVNQLPVDPAEMGYLRMSEIAVYLDSCAGRYRPLAAFLIGTGARVSEAVATRWEDLDLRARRVRIYRQRDRYTDGTARTKGRRFRGVEIGPELADALRRLRALRMAAGVDDGGWLFLCPAPKRGRYANRIAPSTPHRKTVHEWHEAALEDAGLRDMPLHSLRHTAAAAWLATGHPLMFVQRQLGHASITTTERHYGHLEATFLKSATAATEAAIRDATPALTPVASSASGASPSR